MYIKVAGAKISDTNGIITLGGKEPGTGNKCVILYGSIHITPEPGQGWNLLSAIVTILVAFNTTLKILVLILVIIRVVHIR